MIYRGDFDSRDIGGQINLKTELQDILDAFKNGANEAEETDPQILSAKGSSFLIKPSGEIRVTTYIRVGTRIRSYMSDLVLRKYGEINNKEYLNFALVDING